MAGMIPGQFSTTQPKSDGGRGWQVLLGIVVAALVITLIATVGSNNRPSPAVTNGSSTGGSSTPGGNTSGASTDPIERARVVLGGVYSYAQVKSVTDQALSATSTATTDTNRSRAWSAVLAAVKGLEDKGYSVAPMGVMRCVAGFGPASGLDFPEASALCATDIAVNP